MRILLITDWNRGQGGAEAYMSWVRSGLASGGDEVRLLTSSAGNAADGSADYIAFGTNRLLGQTVIQIVNPFAVLTLRRAIREFSPDVAMVNMFAHHLSPAVLLSLQSCPIVLLITDYKCICPIGSKLLPNTSICESRAGWICRTNGCVSLPHWIRDLPRYALLRSGLTKVKRILTCSHWMQRALAADGITSDVVLQPVPAPGLNFRRKPAIDPTFVFCGRLDVEKGAALMLRAFARVHSIVPNSAARIIGSGPLRHSLDRLARELQIASDVTFTGWLDPPQLEEQLVDAWALVVPSLWAEPLGLIALEAIVRGVPVIASAIGGLSEIVESERSGLLFPNGDEIALTDRMLAVADRSAFHDHSLASDVIREVSERHAIDSHIRMLRRVLIDAASARTLKGSSTSNSRG